MIRIALRGAPPGPGRSAAGPARGGDISVDPFIPPEVTLRKRRPRKGASVAGGEVAIRIEERFVVRAPPERVWDFMIDPRRVVLCVPGGELHGVVDARTYDGAIRVAVGPIALAYRGRVYLADKDAQALRVRILGDARERGGTDAARLALESRLQGAAGGGTEVVVHARVDVEGRIVALGRGALERLGHVVFRDFSANVRARIEAEHEGRPPPPPHGPLRPVPLILRALAAWIGGALGQRRRASR